MKGYEPTPDFAEPETKFSEQAQFRDLPFLLLFILHFAGIGMNSQVTLYPTCTRSNYWFGPGARRYTTRWSRIQLHTWGLTQIDFFLPLQLAEITAILVGCGFIFSCIYLQLLKFFPKAMVYIGMGFTVLLFAAQAGYCFVRGLPLFFLRSQ